MEEKGVNHTADVAPPTLKYSCADFAYKISHQDFREGTSVFDKLLTLKWKEAQDDGVFNYKMDSVETEVLPGKYKLVTVLSVDRSTLRRKPEGFTSLTQPVDPKRFNFTKIKTKEILAEVQFCRDPTKEPHSLGCCEDKPMEWSLVINTAPICPSHSLLIPSCSKLKPQVMDHEALTLGIHALLLSNTRSMRLGFNSMAGFASVNHQHLHLFYFPHQLYIETAECVHLAGPCYVFKDYHSPGFVFQLKNQDIKTLVSSVMLIVKMCLEEEIAHNMFITRGASLDNDSITDSYGNVRVVIWARSPSYGMKDVSVFAAALCEFGGQVPILSGDYWGCLSEDDIVPVLRNVCQEKFDYLLPKVKDIFS